MKRSLALFCILALTCASVTGLAGCSKSKQNKKQFIEDDGSPWYSSDYHELEGCAEMIDETHMLEEPFFANDKVYVISREFNEDYEPLHTTLLSFDTEGKNSRKSPWTTWYPPKTRAARGSTSIRT